MDKYTVVHPVSEVLVPKGNQLSSQKKKKTQMNLKLILLSERACPESLHTVGLKSYEVLEKAKL